MKKRIIPISPFLGAGGRVQEIEHRVVFRREVRFDLDKTWYPEVDILEKKREIILEVEVPGVAVEDITLLVHRNGVELRGVKKLDSSGEGVTYLRLEREYGHFRRSFALPNAVDPEKVRAVLKDGILVVYLPKTSR